MDIKYKRILLKLSGESLMGEKQYGIDEKRLNEYAEQIKEIAGLGIEIGIVIGGGNIFRGLSGAAKGFDRVKGDQMGMLATVINSLALSSALDSLGQKAHVFTATNMFPIGEHYSKWKAIDAMKRGEIAIISGGTGNPYFTTDTGSALRGIEIEAAVWEKIQAERVVPLDDVETSVISQHRDREGAFQKLRHIAEAVEVQDALLLDQLDGDVAVRLDPGPGQVQALPQAEVIV